MGRWLSDATPLLPLLVGGQQCTFTAQTAPWALPWQPSLRLRFHGDSSKGGVTIVLVMCDAWAGAGI